MGESIKKTYFLAPSFDWPVEGPVRLGSIILEPKNPHIVINSKAFSLPDDVYTREQKDWTKIMNKYHGGFASFFTQFLAVVDAEIGVGLDKNNAEVFKFDKLETRAFIPTKAYIDERLKDPEVQVQLKKRRARAYMITGVKCAYNPASYQISAKKKAAHAEILADLTLATGAPVKIGPAIGGNSGSVSITSTLAGTDVVFAYQLWEIKYDFIEGERKPKAKEYSNRGAFMDTCQPIQLTQEEDANAEEAFARELPKENFVARNLKLSSRSVWDETEDAELSCEAIALYTA